MTGSSNSMIPITNWHKDIWDVFVIYSKHMTMETTDMSVLHKWRGGYEGNHRGTRDRCGQYNLPMHTLVPVQLILSGRTGYDNCVWPSLVCADRTWLKQKEGRSNPRMPWEAWVMPMHRRHRPNSFSYSDTHIHTQKNNINNLSFDIIACRAFAVLQKNVCLILN